MKGPLPSYVRLLHCTCTYTYLFTLTCIILRKQELTVEMAPTSHGSPAHGRKRGSQQTGQHCQNWGMGGTGLNSSHGTLSSPLIRVACLLRPLEVWAELSECFAALYTWIPFAWADSVGLESESELSEREIFVLRTTGREIRRVDGWIQTLDCLESACTVRKLKMLDDILASFIFY
jgi:hypothetical protein